MEWVLAGIVALILAVFSMAGGLKGSAGRSRPSAVPSAVWQYRGMAEDVAEEIGYPFDPSWILATIWQESTGDTRATGAAGEQGLMQMMQPALTDVHEFYPELAQGIPTELAQLSEAGARTQIKAGALYQKLQARRCDGDLWCALAAYNAGYPPGNRGADYVSKLRTKQSKIGSLA